MALLRRHCSEAGPSNSVKWSSQRAEPSGEVPVSSDSQHDDGFLLDCKTATSLNVDSRSKDENASLFSYHSSDDETYNGDSDSDDDPEPATSSSAISFRFHGRKLENWGNWVDRPGVVSKSREAQVSYSTSVIRHSGNSRSANSRTTSTGVSSFWRTA